MAVEKLEVKHRRAVQRAKNNEDTYANLFSQIRSLAANPRYNGLSMDRIVEAFGMAWGSNPNIQHTRLIRNKSQPVMFDRGKIEQMLKDPANNEQSIRQAAASLEFTSYPLYKLKKTLSDILTYRWTYIPRYIDIEDAAKLEFKNERRLVDKFCKSAKPQMEAREIAHNGLKEGKVFKYVRFDIDKSKNTVNAVALQDLPSDYCKIVGRNSVSHYTVAFDFTYFWQAGADINKFPKIFQDYFAMLSNVTGESTGLMRTKGRKVIEMAKVAEAMKNDKRIRAEKINGRYFFWAELPIDECFVFGPDMTSPIQAPMMMGLFLSAQDLSSYEYLQPQLLQMPLYGILTGEIPYHDGKDGQKKSDDVKLSPGGFEYYRALFYEMMASNDTRGVDIFAAPFSNIKLQHFNEVPNSGTIITTAYQDFLTKAGVTGIQSSTDKPMAAMVSTAQKIEPRYADLVYGQFSNMMNVTLNQKLGLKYEWEFEMFGDVFSDTKAFEASGKALSQGMIQFAHYHYALNPVYPMTLEDALSGAAEIRASGLYGLYMPLINSYTISDKHPGRINMPIGDIENEETEAAKDKGTGDGL